MATKKLSKHELLIDALFDGHKSDKELAEAAGKGYRSRISEINKVYNNIRIIKVEGLWRFERTAPIKVKGSDAYPQYYKTGKYVWPAEERRLNAAKQATLDIQKGD